MVGKISARQPINAIEDIDMVLKFRNAVFGYDGSNRKRKQVYKQLIEERQDILTIFDNGHSPFGYQLILPLDETNSEGHYNGHLDELDLQITHITKASTHIMLFAGGYIDTELLDNSSNKAMEIYFNSFCNACAKYFPQHYNSVEKMKIYSKPPKYFFFHRSLKAMGFVRISSTYNIYELSDKTEVGSKVLDEIERIYLSNKPDAAKVGLPAA